MGHLSRRTVRDYGSEGWGFESLRARQVVVTFQKSCAAARRYREDENWFCGAAGRGWLGFVVLGVAVGGVEGAWLRCRAAGRRRSHLDRSRPCFRLALEPLGG